MDRPLSGIDVLDLGQIYQGGYCGFALALLGADVVKVEPPWGENLRTRSADGNPPQYQYLNPNKRGITVDLKAEEGRDLFLELVEEADVLVENFATGKMAELGLGYERLRETNEALVYAHGSGYGDDGPYADYPAMDLTIQAMSGVMDTTGFPEGPPTKAGPAFADFMGAIHLVAGITSALYQRERTGTGQYVEVGMFDTIYPAMASPVAAWVDRTGAPPRTGNQHSGLSIAPYNAYRTEDGYVAIICIAEHQWERLATAIDREDLIGEDRLGSKAKRAKHREEIDGYIQEWVSGRSTEAVVDRLLEANVPCAPVRSVEELVSDPQLRARGMLNPVPNQSDGRAEIPVPGLPIKFSGSDQPEIVPAPHLGEHTDEVLAERLDYGEERIAELHDEDVL